MGLEGSGQGVVAMRGLEAVLLGVEHFWGWMGSAACLFWPKACKVGSKPFSLTGKEELRSKGRRCLPSEMWHGQYFSIDLG